MVRQKNVWHRKEETMVVNFAITDLQARVDEALKVKWRDREFDPGPLEIELDSSAGHGNEGTLDYDNRRARAEFHALLSFPEFAETLEALGADPELTRPVRVVIHSEGEILADHSFRLSGPCDFQPHALLNDETKASVLPGT
jgi:hypothetical protein